MTSLVLCLPAWMCTKAQLPDGCLGCQPLGCTVLGQIRPLCQESLHSPWFNPRKTPLVDFLPSLFELGRAVASR